MNDKTIKYAFFRKGQFVYVEGEHYLVEFDFELSDFGTIEIAVKQKQSVILDWKKNAKEISKSTFMKYYRISKKYNPFTPALP